MVCEMGKGRQLSMYDKLQINNEFTIILIAHQVQANNRNPVT